MRNIFFAVIVVLVSATTSVYAQDNNDKSIQSANNVTGYNADYIEKLGGMKHDQLLLKVDTTVYWKAETIEGFHVGALAGSSLDGPIVGLMFGYSHLKFDADVKVRFGMHKISDQNLDRTAYFAPSAFFEFKPTLFKWGANKLQTNKLYVGGMVGYQQANVTQTFSESTEDYDVNLQTKTRGSGFAYGACIGWERRLFMSGHRFGIQLSAYNYNANWTSQLNTNTGDNSNSKSNISSMHYELTFVWKFVFHKKAKNY